MRGSVQSMSPEQIERYEYMVVCFGGVAATLVAYRWPQIAKSPRQLKVFRWTGPVIMACMALLLLLSALGVR